MKIDKPILFFDGICNLCNTTIDIVLTLKDKDKDFFITSLQGETAKNLLPLHYIEQPSTFIFFDRNGEIITKSKAVLEITSYFRKPWCYLEWFKIIPYKYLDCLYDFIAKKRYRWWGKRPSCRLPTEEERYFFLP